LAYKFFIRLLQPIIEDLVFSFGPIKLTTLHDR